MKKQSYNDVFLTVQALQNKWNNMTYTGQKVPNKLVMDLRKAKETLKSMEDKNANNK